MSGKNPKNADPLFQLFEHHLLTRSYEDSTAFTKEVAEEYLAYLDSTAAHVPLHLRQNVMEDLEGEAHEMLVKKMYGCVKPLEYSNYGKVIQVQKNDELSFCDYIPPASNEEHNPKKD